MRVPKSVYVVEFIFEDPLFFFFNNNIANIILTNQLFHLHGVDICGLTL